MEVSIKLIRSFFTADFSAKVRWRIAFDKSEHLVTTQDKFLLRAYAKSRNVSTPLLLHTVDKAEEIPFEQLPRDCMIKASHGSGWNFIKRDGQFHRFGNGGYSVPTSMGSIQANHTIKPSITETEVIGKCNIWLNQKYSTQEWAYHNMKPRILIEQFLIPSKGDELLDYRFYTFNGRVAAINVGSPSYRRFKNNVFFRPDWTPFELTSYSEQLPDPLPEKPETFSEMLSAAERLGEGIDFARIDFYDTKDGYYLGEMTAYPEGGKRMTPTTCEQFNLWLGKQWKMSHRNEISVRFLNLKALVLAIFRNCFLRKK